jgi:hypothetical protein
MDDLEFRRRLLADPNDNDPELIKTKNQSTTNRHFSNELQQLDLQLKQALNVDIPDNLADRILFHQSSQAQPKNHSPYKRSSMNQLPGHIYYLNYCGFDGNRALHMIVGTDKGKMAVFIVPQTSSQMATDSDHINQSLLLPLQDASLIIVGDKGEKLMPIAEKLKSELYWEI